MDHRPGQVGGADPSDSDRPATARSGARGGLALAVLALLMAGTCWVVASMASPWLVLPYLLLMALILSPNFGRPKDATEGTPSESSTALGPACPDEGEEGSDDDPASAGPSGGGTASATSTAPAKVRRGKGSKARKAKPASGGPAEATWIEVAPGKFVRAEAPTPSAEAGPHAFEAKGPAEPSGSPPSATETDEEPRPSEAAPPEGSDPENSTDAGPGPVADLAPTDEVPPAADGIMPQAGWAFAESSPDRPEAMPGADVPRDQLAPDLEGSLADPDGSDDEPARVAVPPVPVDEPRGFLAESDPTETAVDETVLDDAGPDPETSEAIDPDDSPAGALTEEAAPDEVGPLAVPSWWPRLEPKARPRTPQGRRPLGHGSPPRRLDRSSGPPRRPTDPRRLTRRPAGRPRQVSRTFPPRSPPRRGRPGL